VLYNVKHKGKQFSKEEAEAVIEIVTKYISSGVNPSDIAVLAPFRAQCALIRRMLAAQDNIAPELRKEIVIDTVDRMQGQEREIIIYSFTSGDPSYMADKQDFLYNPNKLNVAFSRAKNKLILLANKEALAELSNPLINDILNYKSIHNL
jgi:superfamily I DNA and/or RNA helicase